MQLAGDFIGVERYTFEPADRKTKVQLTWVGATNMLLFSLFSPFANVGKEHSGVVQKLFKACDSHLCKK